MKNIKIVTAFILGAVIFSGITAFAVTSILGSNVSYDNKNTKLTSTDVQGAVDEIYEKAFKDSCYTNSKTKYTESILNGADPVLGQNMIPVTIADDGKVYYANVNSKWYEYNTKIWANAVMLVDNPSKSYKECEEISNDDIKAYFVWVPRYKYKIWDTGNYDSWIYFSSVQDLEADSDTNVRKLANKAKTIEVVFENKSTTASTESTIGNYLTHPAFTIFNVNGLWIGKFEMTGSISEPTIKPLNYSIRNTTVSELWESLYKFSRSNDSHMMKNTEWGAVAYLSHSKYGINKEIAVNNNNDYKTGYGTAVNLDQSSYPGIYGNTSAYTMPWNTLEGKQASTTGNITGIYDMSGGVSEYMAAYLSGYGVQNTSTPIVSSGFTADPAALKGSKYFDVYNNSSNSAAAYSNRKLGDATGEMGAFYVYKDKDGQPKAHNAWYGDYSYFVGSLNPWFYRGGHITQGLLAGQFNFGRLSGSKDSLVGSRLVLAPNN